MKGFGESKLGIGLEITRKGRQRTLRLSQSKYAASVIERCNLSNCSPCLIPMEETRKHPSESSTQLKNGDSPINALYRQIIGCLMFLVVGTRSDLAPTISKPLQQPAYSCKSHWQADKCVLPYLRGKKNVGIEFGKHDDAPQLVGFSDTDWGGCHNSRKFTSFYLFQLCGGAVSWSSRKETVVVTLECEAEYIALCQAHKKAAWIRRILTDVLGHENDSALELSCNNAGTIPYAHNKALDRRKFTLILRTTS